MQYPASEGNPKFKVKVETYQGNAQELFSKEYLDALKSWTW